MNVRNDSAARLTINLNDVLDASHLQIHLYRELNGLQMAKITFYELPSFGELSSNKETFNAEFIQERVASGLTILRRKYSSLGHENNLLQQKLLNELTSRQITYRIAFDKKLQRA